MSESRDQPSVPTSSPTSKAWLTYLQSVTGKQVVHNGPHLRPDVDENTCVLKFTCGKTGESFFTRFRRYSRNHKFQVTEVYRLTSGPGGAKAAEQSAKSQFGSGDQVALPPSTMTGSESTFSGSDFDFAGWYCAHCGHEGKGDVPSFVQCNRCHEYVCGSRARRVGQGDVIFACHDRCGGTGPVTGSIDGFRGSHLEVSQERQFLLLGPKSPSQRLLPAPKAPARIERI